MLVYTCQDLIFATRIRAACEDLGRVSRPVRNAAMLRARLDRVDDGKPSEPVTAFFVDLERGDEAIELIRQAAGHAAAPPHILAFGPHVMVEALAAARDAGAHQSLARGAFTARLPELIDAAVGADGGSAR